MTTAIYIAILFLLLVLFVLMSHLSYLKTKPKLDEVEAGSEAGSTGNMVMGQSRNYKVKPLREQDKLFINGEQKDISSYKQFIIKGNCMKARNIFEGDIILAELFDKNDEKLPNAVKREKIKENDILLIYLNDEKFRGHKIRVFSGYKNESDELNTFYYHSDGTIRNSKKQLKLEDVKGIVKIKLDK